MYQAYAGRIHNGQPVLTELAKLPERASLIVIVVDNEPPFAKTKAQRQNEAIKQFFLAIDAIDGESISEEDFAKLENNCANFRES